MTVEITTRGLGELAAYFRRSPEIVDEAARIAINDTAALARRLGGKKVEGEVAFPKGYVDDNLKITKLASDADLEATVSGRGRPTSLARFAEGTPAFGGVKRSNAGVRVRVSASGAGKTIPGAFFVKLRRGKGDEGYNVGLAVRLKAGERIKGKRQMAKFSEGVYVLYGPSVAQVFDDVAVEIEPLLSDHTVSEFVRQFQRLSK